MPYHTDKPTSGQAQSELKFSDPTNVAELQRIFRLLKKPGSPERLKQFGQNFLIDRSVRDAIIAAARLTPADQVLEIGPGSGVLTQELVRRAARVVALDIDPYLLEMTRLATIAVVKSDQQTAQKIHGAPADPVMVPKNLELWLQDVRTINLPKLFADQSYVLVSNVPYYLSGYLLELFTSTPVPPKRMVLMLQREVAQRITAAPEDQTILSIALALFGTSQILQEVPRTAFWPQPEVDSAVIAIERHTEPPVEPSHHKRVMRVVKAGFSARRKLLANALAGGLQLDLAAVRDILAKAGFASNSRAQELTVQNWIDLSKLFS